MEHLTFLVILAAITAVALLGVRWLNRRADERREVIDWAKENLQSLDSARYAEAEAEAALDRLEEQSSRARNRAATDDFVLSQAGVTPSSIYADRT